MPIHILEELTDRYQHLQACRADIEKAFAILKNCYENYGCVYVCGNGGSSSDSDHIVGELMKSFRRIRPINPEIYKNLCDMGRDAEDLRENLEGSLPAVSLNSQTAIMTAYSNDRSWDAVFAQQLYGLGKRGDCLIAISTSGNSQNCVYAAITAKAMGISVISLTGRNGGRLAEYSDCTITVPEDETFKIQELHLPVYHCLCAMLEEAFFGNG